jgi:hypothetical protein
MEPVDGDDTARLLGRLAGEVPVAPAPVGRVVDAARQLRRRQLLIAAVLLLAVSLLVALL